MKGLRKIEWNVIFEIWPWSFVDASYYEIILKTPFKWESVVLNSHFFLFRFLSFPTIGWLDTAPFSVEVLSSSMCSCVSFSFRVFIFWFLYASRPERHESMNECKYVMEWTTIFYMYNFCFECYNYSFIVCVIFFCIVYC